MNYLGADKMIAKKPTAQDRLAQASGEILKRALHSPILYRFWAMHQRNEITYDEAIHYMVLALDDENRELKKNLQAEYARRIESVGFKEFENG